MPKRRAETPAVSMSDMSLADHLAAAQAHEAHRVKRQQELRPAPSTVSPDPYIDPLYNDSMISGNLFDLDPTTQKGRKAIVSTKRAQQNRAAQQAFRQRKDGHIRELEDQVNHLKVFETSHKQLQIENSQLRDYVAALQSALIEFDADIPHPPPGLDLENPRPDLRARDDIGHAQRRDTAPIAQMASMFEGPLRSLLEETDEASREHSQEPEGDAANGDGTAEKRTETLESQIEPSLLAQSRPSEPQAV